MAHIDAKVMAWGRYIVSEEIASLVAKKVLSGDIQTDSDVCEFLEEIGAEYHYEIQLETSEDITPKENGCVCVEVFDEEGNMLMEEAYENR